MPGVFSESIALILSASALATSAVALPAVPSLGLSWKNDLIACDVLLSISVESLAGAAGAAGAGAGAEGAGVGPVGAELGAGLPKPSPWAMADCQATISAKTKKLFLFT